MRPEMETESRREESAGGREGRWEIIRGGFFGGMSERTNERNR